MLPMLWSNSLWALWFFTGLYTVLDASIPVFWASVGDFFGRKSFGTIRGNMNLFYTWGAILGPFVAGAIYDRTQSYALVFTGITIALLISTAMTALLDQAVDETRNDRSDADSLDLFDPSTHLPSGTGGTTRWKSKANLGRCMMVCLPIRTASREPQRECTMVGIDQPAFERCLSTAKHDSAI